MKVDDELLFLLEYMTLFDCIAILLITSVLFMGIAWFFDLEFHSHWADEHELPITFFYIIGLIFMVLLMLCVLFGTTEARLVVYLTFFVVYSVLVGIGLIISGSIGLMSLREKILEKRSNRY